MTQDATNNIKGNCKLQFDNALRLIECVERLYALEATLVALDPGQCRYWRSSGQRRTTRIKRSVKVLRCGLQRLNHCLHKSRVRSFVAALLFSHRSHLVLRFPRIRFNLQNLLQSIRRTLWPTVL